MKKTIPALLTVLCLSLLLGAALADRTFEGVTVPDDADYVDFGDHAVSDLEGLADFLEGLPNVTRVDMFANEMTKDKCDALAERFPQIRWGWTLVIRSKDHKHLVRTDADAFSTLHNNKSTPHTSEDFAILKYCWNMKALDIGHNAVTDIGFLRDLPELRVLIIACNRVEDISPLADLHYLEYAELFKNRIEDLTPLSGLDHLLDLNICFNRVHDWSPLTSLTQLKRLWCYRSGWYYVNREIPKSEVAMLKQALPNTEIDSTHYSTAGTWRWLNKKTMHPHYAVITTIFGADSRHPGTGYVPFEDSFPVEEPAAPDAEPAAPEEETAAPAEEPAGPEEEAPEEEPQETPAETGTGVLTLNGD